MLVESIAIIVIFAVMIFIFLRAGKKNYAIAASPLIVVPLFQIIANILNEIWGKQVNADIKSITVVVGLAIAMVMLGLLSNVVGGKKPRAVYLMICSGFTIALTIIYLCNNYVAI